jgi:DNA-directed RNA polymerase subunit RPC12/RpoP
MSRYACPDCHRDLDHPPKRGRDARCQPCRDLLPVNGRWPQRDRDPLTDY